MIYACKMEQKDNPENKTIRFGCLGEMTGHALTNSDNFYSEIEPAKFHDMGAEVERLTAALKMAELQLLNCSWETGDSNRAKVATIKAQLKPLIDELKAAGDEL